MLRFRLQERIRDPELKDIHDHRRDYHYKDQFYVRRNQGGVERGEGQLGWFWFLENYCRAERGWVRLVLVF